MLKKTITDALFFTVVSIFSLISWSAVADDDKPGPEKTLRLPDKTHRTLEALTARLTTTRDCRNLRDLLADIAALDPHRKVTTVHAPDLPAPAILWSEVFKVLVLADLSAMTEASHKTIARMSWEHQELLVELIPRSPDHEIKKRARIALIGHDTDLVAQRALSLATRVDESQSAHLYELLRTSPNGVRRVFEKLSLHLGKARSGQERDLILATMTAAPKKAAKVFARILGRHHFAYGESVIQACAALGKDKNVVCRPIARWLTRAIEQGIVVEDQTYYSFASLGRPAVEEIVKMIQDRSCETVRTVLIESLTVAGDQAVISRPLLEEIAFGGGPDADTARKVLDSMTD